MRKPAHLDELRQEEIYKAHGEVSVSNGAAKGALLSAFDVDVDPLAILGHFGKTINARLVNFEPVSWAKLRAFAPDEGLWLIKNLGHPHAL